MRTKECIECGERLYASARVCPYCYRRQPVTWRFWGLLLLVFLSGCLVLAKPAFKIAYRIHHRWFSPAPRKPEPFIYAEAAMRARLPRVPGERLSFRISPGGEEELDERTLVFRGFLQRERSHNAVESDRRFEITMRRDPRDETWRPIRFTLDQFVFVDQATTTDVSQASDVESEKSDLTIDVLRQTGADPNGSNLR
jgi:hypothetical protein